MNAPLIICEDSFQEAWRQATQMLIQSKWELWNLVVQIKDPTIRDERIHHLMEEFSLCYGLIGQNQVSYTIFPTRLYKEGRTREDFYARYWKYFSMTRKMEHSNWGTYFQRMIRYETPMGDVDQLGSIIDNINSRSKNYGAANVIIIPQPKKDCNKQMGAPCLNYITVQVEKGRSQKRIINLLAVYRNHDFTIRTYGNYLGLCNLLQYIADQTGSSVGQLVCISSHAYASRNREPLKQIIQKLGEL